MNTFNVQNILNRHASFQRSNMVSKTSINENFVIFISLLKNKAYQTYRIKLLENTLVNNCKERLKSGDYTKLTEPYDRPLISRLMLDARLQSQSWLTDFARQLPGFDKFDLEDFNTIVEVSTPILLTVIFSEFFVDGQFKAVINNFEVTSRIAEIMVGRHLAELILDFSRDFNQLKFNEYEIALFFPFVLTSCNCKCYKSFFH